MFGVFEQFPYVNFHEVNLNWIISKVKEYIAKTDKAEIDFLLLEGKFDALKEYIDSFIDDLDLMPIINERITEMIESGELANIIQETVVSYAPMHDSYNGEAIVRYRSEYRQTPGDESSPYKGYQNGVIYSPSGDYSNNGIKYLYIWQTWEGNQDTKLCVFDCSNNSLIHEQIINNAGHGGPMAIDPVRKKLWCITNNRLMRFDISEPGVPVIERNSTITEYQYIIGIKATTSGATYYVMKNDNSVYSKVNFNDMEGEYLYTLTEDSIDVLQDICIDFSTNLIYRLTYGPNVIHVYNAITGAKISSMAVPEIISNIGIAEPEMISCHGIHLFYAGITAVGTPGSTKLDLAAFHMDLRDKFTNRVTVYNEGSIRNLYIDYVNGDPLNKDVLNPLSHDYNTYKYIEDAQNAARDINQVYFRFETDYPESFYIYRNGQYGFNQKKTGAFRVEADISINGLLGDFYGNPIKFSTPLTTWIYAAPNSQFEITSMPAHPGGADFILWAQKASVNIINRDAITDIFLEESILSGLAILDGNIYVKNSRIEGNNLNIRNANTIYIDGLSIARITIADGMTAKRIKVSDGVNYKYPQMGNWIFQNSSHVMPPLMLVTTSAQNNLKYAYFKVNGVYAVATYNISREVTQCLPNGGTHAFEAYHYTLSFNDITEMIDTYFTYMVI